MQRYGKNTVRLESFIYGLRPRSRVTITRKNYNVTIRGRNGSHFSDMQIELQDPQLGRMGKAILNVWSSPTYRTALSGSDWGRVSALFLNEMIEKDNTTNYSKYDIPCCMLSFGWFPGVWRRRGITQKKAHNIQYTAKVWNQDCDIPFSELYIIVLCFIN